MALASNHVSVCLCASAVRRCKQVSGWEGAAKLQCGGAANAAQVVVYRGMTDCFLRTCREEGPKALFKGLWANYLKVSFIQVLLLQPLNLRCQFVVPEPFGCQ